MPTAMFMDPQAAIAALETGKARQVIDACSSLEKHIKANQDNLRGFFSEYYLRICRRVFGAGCPSLLGEVSHSRREYEALLNFLDPGGMLFQAMVDVDKAHLNHFRLPVHMLSAHAQKMLLTVEGVQILSQWPHYAAPLESSTAQAMTTVSTPNPSPALSHLIAPLTSTFLIMMASASRYGTAITVSSAPASSQQSQLTSEWHVLDSPLLRQGMERLAHRTTPSRIQNSPYIVLVRTYLRSLLPQGTPSDDTTRPPSTGVPPMGAQFLTAILDMWLTDIDMPNPSAASVTPSTRRRGSPSTSTAGRVAQSPSAPRAATDFTVPTTLLVSAIKGPVQPRGVTTAPPSATTSSLTMQELVSHIYLCPPAKGRGAATGSTTRSGASRPATTPAQAGDAWLPRASTAMCSTVANLPWLPPISAPNIRHTLAHQLGASASPAVQNVAAHVYRFLHRAFLHWPVGQSAEQLDAVVDLWLAVAFPWTGVDRAKYTEAWRSHVLAHLPFYFCLLPMYLDLVTHTASVAAQQAAKHLRRVGRAFYRETELCKLLREVEMAHRCLHAGRSIPDSAQPDLDLSVLVPLTAQQFVLLERAAVAGHGGKKAAEDFTDFQIFSEDVALPPGAQQARAHRAAAKTADVLQLLQGNVPGDVYRSLRDSLSFLDWQRFQTGFHRQEHQLQYTPQARGVIWGGPSGVTPSTVPYKGEFLLRPAARNEVSVLVEPLATASIKLNEWLGFYSEENLDALHPVFKKAVVRLRRRGCYIDLRRLFERESLAFLTLTSTGLFFVMSHFVSQAVAVLAICLFQMGLLAYCIM